MSDKNSNSDMTRKLATKMPAYFILRTTLVHLDKVLEGEKPIEERCKLQMLQMRETLLKVLQSAVKALKTGLFGKKEIQLLLAKKLAKEIRRVIRASHRYKLIFQATKDIRYRKRYAAAAEVVLELIKIQKTMHGCAVKRV